MLTADDIVAIMRPIKERAEDGAWHAAVARLGGRATDEAGGVADDDWPPEDIVISGPDWTTIKGAVHESGWSETTIRKYRREIGIYRFGQWYIFRPRLERVLSKPRVTSQ